MTRTLAGSALPLLHITFVTFQLGGGGAEMQLLRLANTLDRAKFRVSIIVFRKGGNYEGLLASDVELVDLGNPSKLLVIGRMRRAIARLDPDLVCAFLDIPITVAFLATRLAPRPPVIVGCVQAPPTIVYGPDQPIKLRAFLRVYGRILPHLDRVIAISQGVKTDIATFSPKAAQCADVIYNIGVDRRLKESAREPVAIDKLPARPLVVACGRLNYQKAFPDLIQAFALVQKAKDAELWIIGEGEDRPKLQALVDQLGLTDRVKLVGFKHNPYRIFAHADLFVLSSIFEGFGNVIIEAMACGVPVVSTACPHGPSEIIQDHENGILVPVGAVDQIAAAMLEILNDEALAGKLSSAGGLRARDFTAELITAQYADVFERVCRGRTGGRAMVMDHAGSLSRHTPSNPSVR